MGFGKMGQWFIGANHLAQKIKKRRVSFLESPFHHSM
jgi:hypothetical protein